MKEGYVQIFATTFILLTFHSLYTSHAQTDTSQEARISAGLAQFLGEDADPQCTIDISVDPTKRYINRFAEPSLTTSPGECCQRCLELKECIAWIWHACCNHCWIKDRVVDSLPEQADYCGSNDCVRGKVDRSGDRTRQDLLRETERFMQERPIHFYLPSYLRRCDKELSWTAATVALQACGDVKEKCGLNRRDNIPGALDIHNLEAFQRAPSCRFENGKEYRGKDIVGYDPHPNRQSAEECCRRCQEIRACFGWTRYKNGQCHLKWEIKPDVDGYDSTGTVAALKINVPSASGPEFKGAYHERNPDESPPTNEANTTETCKQACEGNGGCLVWSFGEGNCILHYTNDRWRFRLHENYTTGFIVSVNETQTCREIQSNITNWNVTELAYSLTEHLDPICYRVLEGENNSSACEASRAQNLFYRRVKRTISGLQIDEART